jgi:uncharacterized iron-regulated protein
MRLVILASSLLVVLFASGRAAAQQVATSLPSVPGWTSSYGKEHRLAGRIWNARRQEFLEPAALASELHRATFVLLGETHDNEDDHRLQAWIVASLIASGRRPAVAFEMLDLDQAGALRRHLGEHPQDAVGLGAALGWERSGWPPWRFYEPIVQEALDAQLPILPANLPASEMRAVAERGIAALGAARVAELQLGRPLPKEMLAHMQREIAAAHCGMLPEGMVDAMTDVLAARDATMAVALVQGARLPRANSAVLIAGSGHARVDHGVPWHLRRLAAGAEIATVSFVEVQDGETDPSAYVESAGSADPRFDYIWFTPRARNGDSCKERQDELIKRMRGKYFRALVPPTTDHLLFRRATGK